MLRRRTPSFLVVPLLLVAGAAAATEPLDVELWIGESVRLRTGLVQQILNLDPELVAVGTVEPDVLQVTGLEYGVATIRVWTARGALVVRARVRGLAPSRTDLFDPADRTSLGLESSLRHYTYSSFQGTDTLTAQTLAANLPLGMLSGSAEAWLEQRQGSFGVPHYLVTLQQSGVAPGHGPQAAVGTLAPGWSRYTLATDRLEVALVDLPLVAPDAGRPSLGVTVVGGRDAPDAVSLGGRYQNTITRPGERYGGRMWWRPSSKWHLFGEAAAHEVMPDTLNVVGAAGAELSSESVQGRGLLGFDGQHWAGSGAVNLSIGTTNMHVNAEHTDHGYRNTLGAMSGVTAVSGAISQLIGSRGQVDLSAATRELDPAVFGYLQGCSTCRPEPWTRASRQTVMGSWRFSDSVTLRAALVGLDEGLGDSRWKGSRGGVEMDFVAPSSVRLRGTIRLESIEEQAEGRVSGQWSWNQSRLDLRLSVLDWLTVDGSVEHRFAVTAPDEGPEPLLWSAGLRGRLASLGPISNLGFSAGLRSWDHLSTSDGHFYRGRHLSASMDLESMPWHGLRLQLRGSWSRDMERQVDSSSVSAAVVYALSRGRSQTNPARRRSSVEGLVFADGNANGARDFGEAGLPGVKLRLTDGRETTTGKDGGFRFRRTEADAAVRLVQESAPPGLVPTGPSIVGVGLSGSSGRKLAFGLGPEPGRFEVLAFNDLDGDGARDAGEPLVDSVTVTVGDGGTVRTSGDGPTGRKVAPGTTIAAELVDSGLPAGYSCTASESPQQSASSGEIVSWQIPLQARRSIRGEVVLDGNGNGRRDPGEAAGAGLVVMAGARVAVSDSSGRFTLTGLPAGQVSLKVHPSQIPAGWVPGEAVTVELETGPCTHAGVEIFLLRDEHDGGPESPK